jgi:hypothetical protein
VNRYAPAVAVALFTCTALPLGLSAVLTGSPDGGPPPVLDALRRDLLGAVRQTMRPVYTGLWLRGRAP